MASLPSNGRRRRPTVAAAGVALAVCSAFVAGCGGPSKARGGGAGAAGAAASPTSTIAAVLGAPRPACGLITQAEVEAALGAKVNAGRESIDATRSVCSFALASAADQSVILVSTTSSAAAASFATARDNLGSAAQSVTAGDQAFVAGAQAAVRKGSSSVVVLIAVRQPPAGLTPAATKMVQAIASRL